MSMAVLWNRKFHFLSPKQIFVRTLKPFYFDFSFIKMKLSYFCKKHHFLETNKIRDVIRNTNIKLKEINIINYAVLYFETQMYFTTFFCELYFFIYFKCFLSCYYWIEMHRLLVNRFYIEIQYYFPNTKVEEFIKYC